MCGNVSMRRAGKATAEGAQGAIRACRVEVVKGVEEFIGQGDAVEGGKTEKGGGGRL